MSDIAVFYAILKAKKKGLSRHEEAAPVPQEKPADPQADSAYWQERAYFWEGEAKVWKEMYEYEREQKVCPSCRTPRLEW